jgi:integrase
MAGQLIRRGARTWLVRVYTGLDETGKRQYYNKTVNGTKHDAQDALNDLLRDRSLGHLTSQTENRTVTAILDDLVLDYKVNGKSLDWCRIVVDKHLRPFFGEMALSKVTTDAVNRYIAARHDGGIQNGTINRELALLRRSFNLALRSTPPKVTRVPFIPELKENAARQGYFEHTEYRQLRDALPAEIKPVIAFGYYTGCRKGEILPLEWPQVDLTERVIRLEPGATKNDEARVIPLCDELYQTLAMLKAERDLRWPESPWVFSREGRRILKFNAAWKTACRAAGLWTGDEKTGRPSKLFHDLRRTAIRNMIRGGTPETIAMKVSGHKTRAVFDRYNIVSETDLKDAARRLSEYVRGKEAEAERHTTRTPEPNPHTIRTQREKPDRLQ